MNKKVLKAAVIMAVFITLILGFVFSVYYGYFHINGLIAGKYPVRGVDVSHYQGEIDWQVLSGQDIQFAYIKATEGSSHTDERFSFNCEKARGAGLTTGAYHFFSFDSPGSAQAQHFIRTVEPFEGMLAPAVDVEFYGDKKENPPIPALVEAELKDFLDQVEQAYGRKPVIYATKEAWELYIRGRFDDYPLWIRDIWQKPVLKSEAADGKEYNWTFWQYTNRGRLKGFSGEETFVDLNVFYGTWEEWLQSLASQNRETLHLRPDPSQKLSSVKKTSQSPPPPHHGHYPFP